MKCLFLRWIKERAPQLVQGGPVLDRQSIEISLLTGNADE
jgi:hypothetical protein